MRIPITLCHGISYWAERLFDPDRLRQYLGIARDLGFETISYDDLAAWRAGTKALPAHPFLFDIDHPVASIHHLMLPILESFGYHANLFIQTAPLMEMYGKPLPSLDKRELMTWEELHELVEHGWKIGAHTHTHPDLSVLHGVDPTGSRIREEFETNNAILERELGVRPRDVAFTGTSWSSVAEREAKRLYRFIRLWIIGTEYDVDGRKMRFAELVGVDGDDEADGGPPYAARYATAESDPYRLPSVDLQQMIRNADEFRRYFEMASCDGICQNVKVDAADGRGSR